MGITFCVMLQRGCGGQYLELSRVWTWQTRAFNADSSEHTVDWAGCLAMRSLLEWSRPLRRIFAWVGYRISLSWAYIPRCSHNNRHIYIVCLALSLLLSSSGSLTERAGPYIYHWLFSRPWILLRTISSNHTLVWFMFWALVYLSGSRVVIQISILLLIMPDSDRVNNPILLDVRDWSW